MPGSRLFPPSDSMKGRDIQSNVIDNGFIVQPPRYAELGGLSSSGKAVKKNQMNIRPPGSTERTEPVG